MKKKHGKGRLSTKLLTIVFLCVFLFSMYKVVSILLEYHSIDKLYDETSQRYTVENEAASEEPEDKPIEVSLEELRKLNKDVIGWIYIPDTNVSFPLLQGSSNKQYLYQSYKKEYLTAGSIFLDYRCDAEFKDKSTVIYGHNMHNGSMFGSLKKYKAASYMKEHPYIYILKQNGDWSRYEISAFYQASVDGPTYRLPIKSEDKKSFRELIDTINADNIYSGVDAQKIKENDTLIILSTCTQDSRDDIRVTIAARLTDNDTN